MGYKILDLRSGECFTQNLYTMDYKANKIDYVFGDREEAERFLLYHVKNSNEAKIRQNAKFNMNMPYLIKEYFELVETDELVNADNVDVFNEILDGLIPVSNIYFEDIRYEL